jgi:lysophospholipase L1-like esterase
VFAASTASAQPLSPACALPDAMLALPGHLDRAIARLAAGQTFRIVALGSSSTEGIGASSPQATYPARLQAELQRRLGTRMIEVLNRGIGGEVVATTAARMKRNIEALKPDLVIWQVGTNDVVKGVSPADFAHTLRDGLAWLAAHKIDVVLMDPQMFPKGGDQPSYAHFVEGISTIGLEAGVPVLHRFAAMHAWAALPDGVRRPMLWNDSFHMNDQGYACVGEMLAEAITRRMPAPVLAAASRPRGQALVHSATATAHGAAEFTHAAALH